VTAGQVGAVVVSVAVAVLVVGLVITLVSATVPLVSDMQATVAQANAELDKVDGLLVTAGSIGTTVDSASRLAYRAFYNPVVKVLAFGAGTARASRRLRRRREG